MSRLFGYIVMCTVILGISWGFDFSTIETLVCFGLGFITSALLDWWSP